MTGSFVLLRPGWLAVCITLIAGYAAILRASRKHRTAGVEAASVVRGMSGVTACVLGVAATTWWLAYVHSAVGYALLLMGGMLAAACATVESYRRVLSSEGILLRILLVGGRTSAWVLLLILAGRPAWDWIAVEWRKPRLSVLLDDSLSMSIDDAALTGTPVGFSTTSQPTSGPATSMAATRTAARPIRSGARGLSRAEIVNDQIRRLRGEIGKLAKYFDVHVSGLGPKATRLGAGRRANDEWLIEPSRQLTSLAAGIERAANLGANPSSRPHGVLVISDGAENVDGESGVRKIASRLAEAGVALYAVGAGPRASEVRSVEIDPLNLPARIGMHDRLNIQVRARLRGYAGGVATVEVSWADETVGSKAVRLDQPMFRLTSDFEASPPAPGFHRLTARITLGPAFGAESFETHALIEVTQGRTRVLMLEATPRTETAFVTRALLGDERFELTRKFLPRKPGGLESEASIPAEMWDDYDVVLLGSVPRWRLTRRSLMGLLDAVDTRGVGLLLAGGRQLFNDGRFAGTPLEDASPAAFLRTDEIDRWRPRFVPTETGLTHPLMRQSGDPAANADLWRRIPRLAGAADISELKPLATVLADDGAGRPLLATLDYGKGRCVAAAWESTWGWALRSKEGSKLHRTFWRQLAAWLANRRPRAWVTPDELVYPVLALESGQKQVRVRAGVTGLEDVPAGSADASDKTASRPSSGGALRPKLTALDPAGNKTPVRLQREGEVWVAELRPTVPGDYELHFTAGLVDGEKLEASSRFTVARFDLEHKTPTANLALLREAAEMTAEQGGRFVRIEALESLLSDLARDDRRTRIERPMLFDPVDRGRWFWLVMMVALLGLEWMLRKRAGLV